MEDTPGLFISYRFPFSPWSSPHTGTSSAPRIRNSPLVSDGQEALLPEGRAGSVDEACGAWRSLCGTLRCGEAAGGGGCWWEDLVPGGFI